MRVKATREGLVGQATASAWKIDRQLPFVALPSHRALRRFVRVRNPLNGRQCIAVVMDVGPWNEADDDYVFLKHRPAAESKGIDTRGRPTNGAGIDLGEAVWTALDMRDNTDVEWEFIE